MNWCALVRFTTDRLAEALLFCYAVAGSGVTVSYMHRRAVDMSQAGSNHPARSARSKFEAPSGGDFYPEENRQNKAFLFGR